MALPVFRSASAKAAGTGAVTPALPASMVAGDIVILVATTIAGGSISITAVGSIATWTALSGSPIDVASGEKLYVWWGRWTSGTTGPTVTPGSDHCCAGTVAYSGCVPNGSPIGVITTSTEATVDTSFSFVTGLTTLENDVMCICVCSQGSDSNTATIGNMTNASLGSLANRQDFCTNSGLGGGYSLQEGTKAVIGSMGTFASTLSTASSKAYIAFSLRPVVAVTADPGVGNAPSIGFAPTVTVTNNVSAAPSTGGSVSAGFAPTVTTSNNQSASPGPGNSTSTGFAPTVIIDVIINTGVGNAVSNGFSPTVNISDHQSASPGVGQSVSEGFSPTINISDHITASPSVGNATSEGYNPTIHISDNAFTQTGESVSEGYAVTINISDNINVQPGTGESISQGYAPQIGGDVFSTPDVGESVSQGYQPTINISESAFPDVGQAISIGFAPTIDITNNANSEPGTGLAISKGYNPIIEIGGGNINSEPQTGESVSMGFAPIVTVTHIYVYAPNGSQVVLPLIPDPVVVYPITNPENNVIFNYEPEVTVVYPFQP